MRTKWGLAVMLLAMLAAPMLACGFPLPAGTSMMAVSKAVCAEGEATATCQLRQDAYQLMGKLNSASINAMAVDLYVNDGSAVTQASIAGAFDYVVSESAEYLGASVSATLGDAQITAADGTQDLSNMQFIIIDDKGYTSSDGGKTWVEEELDATALVGLSFLLGLSGTQGASLDLFNNPAIFTVSAGADETLDGQTMKVQTLTVDLQKLLGSSEALLGFFDDAAGMNLAALGVDLSDLGNPQEVAMVAPMLEPFLAGTAVSVTLWIGADDGYIHRIEEHYSLVLDMTAVDPTSAKVEMTYSLEGVITNHNRAMTIAAPTNATEGEGGLFGSSGLSQGLFGN